MRLMGYSVRDERWRLTVWREDGGHRVVATELYDETNDSAETRNLAADPAQRAVVEQLSRHLPAIGPPSSRGLRKRPAAAAATP